MEKIIITQREYDVLELVAQGYTNKEISEKLCITLTTVATHLHNLYSKALIDYSAAGHSAMRVKLVLKYQKNLFEVRMFSEKYR